MTLTKMKWYLICPTPTTVNLCTNPSFEAGTAGWEAYNGTISQSLVQQSYGVYSCRVMPETGTVSGAYYSIALTSGSVYVFSVDVYGVNGQSMAVWFADSGTTLAGTQNAWTANGHWQRRSVSWAATASATYKLMVTRGSIASLGAWYFDAAQLENTQESTYIDGDQPGLVRDEVAYYWNGTRHASASTRSSLTRAGGTLLDLDDYMQIKQVQGLGMAPVSNSAVESSLGGAYYQNTIAKPRDIIISGCVTGDNSSTPEGNKQTKMDALMDAIAFDHTKSKQEMVLEYQGEDDSGVECSERLRVNCVYNGGLERSWDNSNYEDVVIKLTAYQPWLVDSRERAIDCGYQYEIDGANCILKRDGITGQWGTLGTGLNDSARSLAMDQAGNLYVGGNFSTPYPFIAKWNGAGWGSLSSGMNNAVYTIALDASGTLYAGGAFATAGSIACAKIARWNGVAWGSLGSGMNNTVQELIIDNKNAVYACGDFGTAGGVTCAQIAKWNGTTWGSLSSGLDGVAYALAIDSSNNLYVGGWFDTAGGVACNVIAKWNGSTWGSLGSGLGTICRTLEIDKSGMLYAGGEFLTAGGGTVNYIAKWNGNTWSGIGSGANDVVYTVRDCPNGLIVAGNFTTMNGRDLSNIVRYKNNTVYPLSIRLPATAYITDTLSVDQTGDLYIGISIAGTAYSCIASTPSCGGAVAYPIFEVTGPGTIYSIENYTTKQVVMFNDLYVNAGQTLFVDFTPDAPSISVDFDPMQGGGSGTRGIHSSSKKSYLLPGSNMDLKLMPSVNNVDVLVYGGTSAATKALMRWRNRYWTVDQAKYT